MGWNAGFTAMEAGVMRVYDSGALTRDILDAMMEPYKYTDCDFGGCMDLKTNDGLGIMEVICKTMEPEKYQEVLDNPKWYEGHEPGTWPYEKYGAWESNKAAYDLFQSIWDGQWHIF